MLHRKPLGNGDRFLIADLRREVSACQGTPALQPFAQALTGQLDAWQAAIAALRAGALDDADYPLRVADDLLAAVGHVLMAWAWARIARTALLPDRAPAAGGRSAEQWTQSATFGLQWLLPQAAVHWARVMQPQAQLPFVTA